MEKVSDIHNQHLALKSIALFEAFKGIVIILAGFGCLAVINRDLQAIGEHVVSILHMSPDQHYPAIFLATLEHLGRKDLLWLSAGAAVYSTLKFIEGYGLWHARVWAEWLAIISGGIYIPFEFYELYKQLTWIRLALTGFNVALVVYLLWLRKIKVAARAEAGKSHPPA
jgi:uncharacterized membrane protein (DUF2068 family)